MARLARTRLSKEQFMTKHIWMSPPNHPRQRFLIERKYAFKLKAEGWTLAK